ncbi:uncharacterized protein LOC143673806 [Tamandua tetradactyla]|uniref:uncharacterized protein LOC143673806 n=1 Tax=Tamandua tetradactyla TaxID=48850 RepID=UPI004053C8D3
MGTCRDTVQVCAPCSRQLGCSASSGGHKYHSVGNALLPRKAQVWKQMHGTHRQADPGRPSPLEVAGGQPWRANPARRAQSPGSKVTLKPATRSWQVAWQPPADSNPALLLNHGDPWRRAALASWTAPE